MKKRVVICFLVLLLQNGKIAEATDEISFRIEMLPWKEVNQLMPIYTKFTVIDVETGKQFRVQRRAGSEHADVQPLTAKDTKMMKTIYGGKWSWKRRGILIVQKDRLIAASMHGMPHGAGALKNNFPGHFCIHFYGSKTHRTNSMDYSHMLMILKAAGKLEEYLWNANPYEVVQAYIAGLKQQDERIMSLISLQPVKWKPIFEQIENVKLSRLPMLPAEDLMNAIHLDIPLDLEWHFKDLGVEHATATLHLIRFSPVDPWKVDSLLFFEKNHIPINHHDFEIMNRSSLPFVAASYFLQNDKEICNN